jgi:acetolactate synthase-1/2/3 large subunit
MAERAVKVVEQSAPAETISGGHLVAKALKQEGVEVIFTLCGGHIIDIYDGCIDEGIKIIDVRHEQVAAHAADGYARVTGKPGVAVVTAGPGTTDAVTGVANAFRAESPMLLIGGQGALDQHRMGSLQDLPHVDIMRPITKFASSVLTTERVADMVAMAFRECYAGAPGPSFLEIGRDILDKSVDLKKAVLPKRQGYRFSTKSLGDPNDVEKLADILVKAKKPCILLGTQVWTCRATDSARRFVREMNVPAYMNGAGRGTLPPGDPHHFQQTRRYAFDNADVIVIVGTPFDFRMGYGKRLGRNATVVQIDLDYRTVGKNRDIDLGLVGDCGVILDAVTQAASGRRDNGAKGREEWLTHLRVEEKKAIDARMPKLISDAHPSAAARARAEPVPDRGHHLHRRRRRRGDLLGRCGAAAPARPLDGSGPARHARRRHSLRHGGEVRAAGEGGALPLRRRLLQPHRLGFRDLRALRPALHRGGRQQLAHEPDPLRPDPEIRQGAGRRRQ